MPPSESVDHPAARKFTLPREGEVIQHQGCNYHLGKYIGEGSWGAVFHCTDDWENELVAKILKPRNRTYEAVKNEWTRELSNLVKLRHPNITFVYDAFEFRDTFFLIIERCEQTICELIEAPNINGEEWLPVVAHSVLQGISFIQKEGYIHKDIHPRNVFSSLIRDKMVPAKDPVIVFKIGDLGITNLETEMDDPSRIPETGSIRQDREAGGYVSRRPGVLESSPRAYSDLHGGGYSRWQAEKHRRGIEIRVFSGNRQGTTPACGESPADGPRFLEGYRLRAPEVRISSRHDTLGLRSAGKVIADPRVGGKAAARV